MSPTARTLKVLRDGGAMAGVVERYLHAARTRIDLFGCIDILAVQGRATIGVQATVGSHHAERIAKAMDLPQLKQWLAGDGTKAKLPAWTLRIQAIVLEGDKLRVRESYTAKVRSVENDGTTEGNEND